MACGPAVSAIPPSTITRGWPSTVISAPGSMAAITSRPFTDAGAAGSSSSWKASSPRAPSSSDTDCAAGRYPARRSSTFTVPGATAMLAGSGVTPTRLPFTITSAPGSDARTTSWARRASVGTMVNTTVSVTCPASVTSLRVGKNPGAAAAMTCAPLGTRNGLASGVRPASMPSISMDAGLSVRTTTCAMRVACSARTRSAFLRCSLRDAVPAAERNSCSASVASMGRFIAA